MINIIFVCGVNGVGKSSVIPYLRELLPQNRYHIHDFDENGVPENAGSTWRASETRHWLEKAQRGALSGITTIICGFVKPSDFGAARGDISSKIRCIFLDASPQIIRARLEDRHMINDVFNPDAKIIGKSVKEFIEGNIYIKDRLKEEFANMGCAIVNTSELKPQEVAAKIAETIETMF